MSRDEFEQRMHEWRDCENAAAVAEEKVRQVGQAAGDPRMGELLLETRALRTKADGLLAALVSSLNDAVANRRR